MCSVMVTGKQLALTQHISNTFSLALSLCHCFGHTNGLMFFSVYISDANTYVQDGLTLIVSRVT